jgi:hypothetical protein
MERTLLSRSAFIRTNQHARPGCPYDTARNPRRFDILAMGHLALQQGDPPFSSLASGYRPLQIVTRCYKCGLSLSSLLHQSVMLTSRHQASVEKRAGFVQLGLRIAQVGLCGLHGTRRA